MVNLKELRKSKKLSQGKLAEKAGCTRSYISQVERGVLWPSVKVSKKLADALGCDWRDFFDE